MFVQVIQGKVSDAAAFTQRIETWVAELSPGATGWLGSTGGVTEDGRFIGIVRFESEEAARANSERPEQDAWWAETAKLIDGEATFKESSKVMTDFVGDPATAGFVQVMQGVSSNPARAAELMTQDTEAFAAFRPDVIGSLSAEHDGGAYTVVIYFTSEAAAREGEQKEVPAELQANMAEMQSLMVGEPEFFDLNEPDLDAPA